MKLGLIGAKLGHSYSKIIHNHFHRLTGLKGSYDLIEIPYAEQLRDRVLNLSEAGYGGINVTIPYKVDVMEFSDKVSDEAKRIGAVNTLIFGKSEIYAYNTDYFGFKTTLEIEEIQVAGNSWTVLGSGGSSKSVIAVLEDMGAEEIKIASRTKTDGNHIPYEQIKSGYGVVNTTPVGMYPKTDKCVLDEKSIGNFEVAVDLIYNPAETVFLRRASNSGLKTANGLMMLVAQAVKAQEIWRNTTFSKEIILEIYRLLEEEYG